MSPGQKPSFARLPRRASNSRSRTWPEPSSFRRLSPVSFTFPCTVLAVLASHSSPTQQYIGCVGGKTGVGNVAKYCTPEVEKLVNQYMEEPNRPKRLAIWNRLVQKYFVDDVAYYVIGWANDRNFVWRDKVKNWERGPGQEYSHAKGGLWRTWLEQ